MAEKNLGKVAVTTGGAYSSTAAYEKLTIVTYEGGSYISKSAVQAGVPPTNATYWQVIAEKGAAGPQGPAGAQGKDGVQGPAGAQGNSGYTGAADELEVVNNLTQGGATAALSAEMGKDLNKAIKAVSDVIVGGDSYEAIPWVKGSTLTIYGSEYSPGNPAICRTEPFWCEVGDVIVFGKMTDCNVGWRNGTSGGFTLVIKESGITSAEQAEYVVDRAAYYMIGTYTEGFNAYPPQKKVVVKGALETVAEIEAKVNNLADNLDVDYINEQIYGEKYVTYPTIVKGAYVSAYGAVVTGQTATRSATEAWPIKAGETVVMYAQGTQMCAIGFRKRGYIGAYTVKYLAENADGFVEYRFKALEDGEVVMSSNTVAFEYFAPRVYHVAAVTLNEMRVLLDDVDSKVNTPMLPIKSPTRAKVLLGAGKKVLLYGDSLSSSQYHNDAYEKLVAAYTGAEVYAGGYPGYTTAQIASDANLQRIYDYDPDLIIFQCGGNETGEDCGTFGAVDDQTLCTPTDITQDFNGEFMIQAVDHMLRKVKAHYYNIIERAGVSLPILSSEQDKRDAVDALKKPYIAIWTPLPQRRSVASSPYSQPLNWLHKRNAVVEVCNLHGFHCIDVYAYNDIDWELEPLYQGEQFEKIAGIYTHDGVHPNQWGYEKICRVIAGSLF